MLYKFLYEGNNKFFPSSILKGEDTFNLTWEGRRLKKYGNTEYIYDENGIRIGKKTNTDTYKYIVEDSKIVKVIKTIGNITTSLDYHFDESGQVFGFNFKGNEYLFVRDLTGNIEKIIDINGVTMLEYKYTAFGTPISNSSNYEGVSKDLFENNIYIYKGYCYDVETGLYYLNSRYYDPEVGRFISPDDISYLDPDSINGLNLYVYCSNNPVMYYDPTGHWLDTVIDIISICWSFNDFIENPSWKTFSWLVLDFAFAVIPFLTGSGGLKALNNLDDIKDLSKITTSPDDIYMLGQTMKVRVIPEAINLGVNWYQGFDYYNDIAKGSKKLANLYGYLDNIKFIALKSLSGAKFIDLGFDAARVGEKFLTLSRFTIYSERFVANTFRIKNLVRGVYRLLDKF